MANQYDPQSVFESPDWLTKTLTREQYEQLSAECGVSDQPDSEIAQNAYGLKNRSFGGYFAKWLSFDRDWRVQFQLARRRLRGIKGEQPAAPKPNMVRCNCGHECSDNLVMSASLGTSCPNCYDRMSE